MKVGIKAILVLVVMLLAPYSNIDNPPLETEDDSLAIAASYWHSIEPTVEQSGLKSLDTRVFLAAGPFDPLNGDEPKSAIKDDADYRKTGMAIVQLNHHTGESLDDLVDRYNLFVLDHMGGSAWLVRLSSPSDLKQIQNDDLVRWAGVMQPGWRLSPHLIGESVDFIAAIPAADLIPEALEGLAHDLVKMGADEAWCGLHLCEIRGDIDLGKLARDGRIIWSEPTFELRLTNAVAGAVVGIPEVVANAPFTLDGSGEIITFTDTGIDRDHPDIDGRVVAVYTLFGLDPSPADSNGGHGTHVALTMVGNGSVDSSATGIAPGAHIIAYALEHDPTGVFGRLGSIYDMLRHAEQEGSRVSVNAWGLNGNQGQYTADSRSIDVFVRDNPVMLPIFSAGDDTWQNASMVMAPSTAKNALSVGASTTSPAGMVANFSAQGPALDGRVKPDIVAPGVALCSGRAEEALAPAGWACGSGTHANGKDMYMTLSGASQGTAVAGGSVSLIREFIREQVGISSPSGALLKAATINGAIDLGVADIPNAGEGWGEISVVNTVMPTDGTTSLSTYHDNMRTLEAGFSSLYSFDLDGAHGIDITLVWSDVAGSANSPQNESHLVNDLDLILYSPDGTIYRGNVFSNGASIPNGQADSINNVERINIPASVISTSGNWQVKIQHSGGVSQTYALVVTADASLTPTADLTVFAGSIHSSSVAPLVNDLITLRISWANQGTVDTGLFRVVLEDLTAGTTLYDGNRNGLLAGTIDSLTMYHSFSTTGDHEMRLSIDVDDQIEEMNDASNGTDNNIHDFTITVTALGVRLVTLDEMGGEDADYRNFTLDPSTAEGHTWPVLLKHEGTSEQSIKLTLSQIQSPHPQRQDMLLPTDDDWSKSSDIPGPFTLQPEGNDSANIYLNITMNDDDADISNPLSPRYAMAGTYVMDLTARYENDTTVSHTIRFRLVVLAVKDVMVASAGTIGLQAQPGQSTSFSISVMNTGNAPALYDLDCYSDNRWLVELGNSNSSSFSFEPLDILEYLPMQVRLYVPPVADGIPSAGSTDNISCSVTSSEDPSLNITETVTLTVKALESFETELFDDKGLKIGPAAYAKEVAVDTSERLNLTLDIVNKGNIVLDLTVRVNPEKTSWAIQVIEGNQTESREVNVQILPGEQSTVRFDILVSPVAVLDDTNRLVIKTSQDQSNFIVNETTLVVKDELAVELASLDSSEFNINIDEDWTKKEFTITNIGNSITSLNWSHSLGPDGWQIGFSNTPVTISPRETLTLSISVIPPLQEPAGPVDFQLGVYVEASNIRESMNAELIFDLNIESNPYASLATGVDKPLLTIPRDRTITQSITVTNDGNAPLSAELSAFIDADNWDLSIDKSSISNLAVGNSVEIIISATPNQDTSTGLEKIIFTVISDSGTSTLEIDASVEAKKTSGGLFGILPTWAAGSVLVTIILVMSIVGIRIKKAAPKDFSGEELVAPDAHNFADDGGRKDAAMDMGQATENLTTGAVSEEEIAAAMMDSMPNLPVPSTPVIPDGRPPMAAFPTGRPPQISPKIATGPPLPPTGLPPGWTMEQWQHYGDQWHSQQGQQ
ncbi:MAG TPA: hypothetical protein EYQ73_02070 [Candidatus Poseidoniales archaeon]|nr:MAG: hypothetical protein CXT71_03045 [Euryarchaeota archaeon]HIF45565.1 hypothetical protein [Candidatus Poseidoniales archaeon]HIL65656.1 hypothetical protein [Candidatus Poseidoniales archaeon]